MTPANDLLVVAGVLEDASGRVLIARRPEHKHHGGFWEFPGGKLEPGESPARGLGRELHEELGIDVAASVHLGVVLEPRPEQDLHLLVRRVVCWHGQPEALEHTALAWVAPAELEQWPLAPADQRLAAWLRAPRLLAVTPGPEAFAESDWPALIQRALERGAQRVHFRAGAQSWRAHSRLLAHLVRLVHDADAAVALHDLPDLARDLRADALHLSERLAQSLTDREVLQWSGPLGVSIHAHTDPKTIERLKPDYLLLGQVHDTASHPDRRGMGWPAFAELAQGQHAPVYAIGGLGLHDLAIARDHGAVGIAAISAFF